MATLNYPRAPAYEEEEEETAQKTLLNELQLDRAERATLSALSLA